MTSQNEYDPSQFEFLPTLTAALHKLVGDPTQSSWSLDSLKLDSPEMAAFRNAIEATKQKVLKAKEYHDSLPGIDLTTEEQDKQIMVCEQELVQKRQQLDSYKGLPVFQALNQQQKR
ncbi:UNVERIFIED_CONTAM: hypothetical protein HDU68_002782 [Siphonaria sp. JEL0065]|nr:hypothetical protein HDU68_002782 [Siphonaria sp. JEL0065]